MKIKKPNLYKVVFYILGFVFLSICGVYSVVFSRIYREYNYIKGEEEKIFKELKKMHEEVVVKERYLMKLARDKDCVEHVARERMGYVKQGEVIFRFDDKH